MNKEKQQRMLLHPHDYTDEELARMLDSTDIPVPDVNKEWERFASSGHRVQESAATTKKAKVYTLNTTVRKMAASFIGVLMLSGITYAAVQWFSSPTPAKGTGEEAALIADTVVTQKQTPLPSESQEETVRIFENAELSKILGEIAAHYQYEVTYKQEEARHLRLYFTWDKTSKIEDVIATFNKFDRIHITQENRKLSVE